MTSQQIQEDQPGERLRSPEIVTLAAVVVLGRS
jgi:hypothetical protein